MDPLEFADRISKLTLDFMDSSEPAARAELARINADGLAKMRESLIEAAPGFEEEGELFVE